MKRKSVTLDDRQVAFIENETEGPTIVFVHGNSQSSKTFSKQFSSKLNDKFHLVALDLWGCGDSSRSEDYSLPIYADLLVKFSKGLGINNALYVGHSLGGHIVLEALEELSVAGAMIFGTPPLANPPAMEMAFLPEPAMGYLFTADLEETHINELMDAFTNNGEGKDMIRDAVTNAHGLVREKLGASVGALNYKDEIEVIRTTETPIAVLHGEDDRFINGDYISALPFETLWKNQVLGMKNVGHFPQLEAADEFNETLLEFADSVFTEVNTSLYSEMSSSAEEMTFPI